MKATIDRIIIAVPDLMLALGEFGSLTGANPVEISAVDDCRRAWLALDNCVLEFQERELAKARLSGLVLADRAENTGAGPIANPRGLELWGCDGEESARFRRDGDTAALGGLRVDHVVLRTGDAPACIALFRDTLGIRLALDKTVPEWGGRMLFFRTGGITLEVIEDPQREAKGDYFWGVAFQCDDIDKAAVELRSRGVALSEIRDGRKPGTRVATLKSSTLDIPGLLIEPDRVT